MDSDQNAALERWPVVGVELAPGLWASAVVTPKLDEAMALAQAKIGNASKDSKNPHFNSSFASLASVIDASRAALSEFGLAVLQPVRARGSIVIVSTLLKHKSGEWLRADMEIDGCKGAQAIGSASTYLRRYGLQGMICVAAQDDDGNAAQDGARDDRDDRRPTAQSQAPRSAPPASKPEPHPLSKLTREGLEAEIGCSETEEDIKALSGFIDQKHPLRSKLNDRYKAIMGKGKAA